MKQNILIDIGSSSIKVYLYKDNNLNLLLTKSVPLKDGFTHEKGISEENKQILFDLIKEQRARFPNHIFAVYGTAIFRKYSPIAIEKFLEEFKQKTGVTVTIISADHENMYLEYALAGKFLAPDNLLLINIGGGSTELVVVKNNQTIEQQNVDCGIGTILAEFPQINNHLSGISLKKVMTFISAQLPTIKPKVSIAFYSGGELRYMQIAGYQIEQNTLFEDIDHPSMISLKDFIKRNAEIFNKISLTELENLMPDNPRWMHGARGCSAFAQAICEKYDIKTIIPSNSNLINGIIRKDFTDYSK